MDIFKHKEDTKKAVDQAKKAIDAGMEELNEEAAKDIAGGGMFDDVPTVIEHSYNDEDRSRY